MHRITVDNDERAAVVTAEGELDAFVAPDLTAAFGAVAHAVRVVADLTAVSFLDSTALGLVVRAVREIGERGGEVRVVLPTTAAKRIFEITALDRALPLSRTRADALGELAGDA